MFIFSIYRHFYGDVLQRAVRQVRNAPNVRLLSELGAQMGVQAQEHLGGDSPLFGRHHQSTGGGDGTILQLLSAGIEARRL